MWKSVGARIQLKLSDKNFKLKFSPRIDFHMLVHTVAKDIIERCYRNTAPTVQIFNNAFTEYHHCRKDEGDEIAKVFVHYNHYYMEVNLRHPVKAIL